MSTMEVLDAALRELAQNCDLDGSAIATEKGQMICSLLPQGTEQKAVSAMAAAILSIGKRVGIELKAGAPRSILIDGSQESIVIRPLSRIVLIGIANTNSDLGLIGFELEQAAKKILTTIGTQE
jgi:predicted regulator of Ras-like GTPase activity (Roadblock/LC7/MglB family)